MNQLEHLRALRDKARIQTEQAEAVLKQQGEISESLDKLIAALEETDEEVPGIDKTSLSEASGAALAAVSVPPLAPKIEESISELIDETAPPVAEMAAPEDEEGVVESLGQLISNLEENPDEKNENAAVDSPSGKASPLDLDETGSEEVLVGEESDDDKDSVEWISEESGSPDEVEEESETPPRLEPIVWEVSDATPVAAIDGTTEVTTPSIPGDDPLEESNEGGDYKFQKLGEESVAEVEHDVSEASGELEDGDDDSDGISPFAGIAAVGTAAVVGAASLLGGDDSEEKEGLIDQIKEKGEDLKGDLEEKVGDTVDTIKEGIGLGNEEEVAVNESDATAPVPPLPPSLGIEPVAASINEVEEVEEIDEVDAEAPMEGNMPPPIPVPVGTPPPPIPVPPIPVPTPQHVDIPPVPKIAPDPEPTLEPEPEPAASSESVAAPAGDGDQFQEAHSSNIFFDANSAYLKESELTKLKAISEAVAGSEARVVKIQGLEDLASSNDFKELLASRRLLAVRKRLAEHGLEEGQLQISEIKLSDEGRVLEPPSISMVPV